MQQAGLFDELPPSPGALPPGLVYQAGFLSADEEAALIALVRRLPLHAARSRSIYALSGEARWGWQHSVAPVDALRWSVTFRTARNQR